MIMRVRRLSIEIPIQVFGPLHAIGGSFIGCAVQMVGGAKNFSMWFGLALMIVTVVLSNRIEREKR